VQSGGTIVVSDKGAQITLSGGKDTIITGGKQYNREKHIRGGHCVQYFRHSNESVHCPEQRKRSVNAVLGDHGD
jgi:hypothetical protein